MPRIKRLSPITTFLFLLVSIMLVHEAVRWIGFLETGITFNRFPHPKRTSFGDADQYIDPRMSNPAQAKKRREFWMERANDSIAINVLKSPQFFASMYPGYPPEMANDEELWNDYFHRVFEIDSYIPEIARKISPEFVLVHSWIGCLDIYRRYGADLLIIGTSETFRAALPEVLSKALKKNGQEPKVLLCTGSALQLDSVKNLADHLLRLRPDLKPDVLFGFSTSTAILRERSNKINSQEKAQELSDYDIYESRSKAPLFKAFEKYHIYSFSNLFPRITWDNVYPETKDAYEDRANLGDYTTLAKLPQKSKNAKRLISMELISDPAALAEDIESRIKPFFHVYNHFDERNCRDNDEEKAFRVAIECLKSIAHHLYVYRPPTTPLAFRAVPPCIEERVNHQVEALRVDLDISVLNQSWDRFGLDYTDFIRVTRDSRVGIVDVQHTNYSGAQKVSNSLAKWMTETTGKIEPKEREEK